MTKNFRYHILNCTALLAMAPVLAHAQTADADKADGVSVDGASADKGKKTSSEIVVTGSRIVRNGYETPTPVSVVSAKEIESQAQTNIIDVVNTLPAVLAGSNPTNSVVYSAAATAASSTINLRGLGDTRTLVLLDGRRVVPSGLNNTVDINELPDALISRIDVVTGGASAAYGSDAVAGVVNFVLDKKFNGIKGTVQGGVTGHGDDKQYRVSLAAGTDFAGGRGHILVSGELAYKSGIVSWSCQRGAECIAGNMPSTLKNPRSWMRNGMGIVANPDYTPTNGQPQSLALNHVGLSTGAPGGIITDGPLAGTYFGPGGTPGTLQYDLISGPFIQGGDWAFTSNNHVVDLDSETARRALFAHISYDIGDDAQIYAQAQYGRTRAFGVCCNNVLTGNSFTIQADNPFIPDAIRQEMANRGLSSFDLGSTMTDFPTLNAASVRSTTSFVIGGTGKFDAFGTRWSWDASAQTGSSRMHFDQGNNLIMANLYNAVDAVRAPNGSIVCRAALTDPGSDCVPWNLMGIGVNTSAAINYLNGTATLVQKFRQHVVQLSISGEPFSTWAGPVSIAFGPEWRRERTTGWADPLSLQGAYWSGNYRPTFGQYDVTEGFVEVAVPLAKDYSWAKSLDLNAAFRATNYSTSGYVSTWKIGVTYSPINDVRFRVTRSRDIRAPNFSEAFAGGVSSIDSILDPLKNGDEVLVRSNVGGNINLKPEKADALVAGVVVQPSWIPGLSASFDYYNISISDAIDTLGLQNIVDQCATGSTAACALVHRDSSGNITAIDVFPINFVTQHARGFDVEASYRIGVDKIFGGGSGELAFRAMVSKVITNRSDNGIVVTETAGETGSGVSGIVPRWKWTVIAGYHDDRFSSNVTMRGIGSGVYDNDWIQCTSNCPASDPIRRTININKFPSSHTFDWDVSYKFVHNENGDATAFFRIDNLLDRDPPLSALGLGHSYQVNANPNLFDVLGRRFTAGIRFKM
jgi:iron complex outermembrane recepter protein